MIDKKIIIGLILALLAGIVVYLTVVNSYAAVFVNWKPVSMRFFKEDFGAALNYYQKALETYDKEEIAVMDSQEVKNEVQRAVLDKLVENSLIHQELLRRMGEKELENLVGNKIGEIERKSSEMKEEIQTIYGFSPAQFKERVLKPMAEQEILEGRFFLENKNLNDWLLEERKKANIVILIDSFKWKDGKVEIDE